MKSHQKHFMSCHLAARQYYDADLVFEYLRVGKEVRLEREMDNPHDPNAVQVIFNTDGEDYLLGYIPRSDNRAIADFLAHLLSRGRGVEVISPDDRAQKISDLHREAVEMSDVRGKK